MEDVAKNDKLAAQESLPLDAGSAGHDGVEANTACRNWQPHSTLPFRSGRMSMSEDSVPAVSTRVEEIITTVRGERVILDHHRRGFMALGPKS